MLINDKVVAGVVTAAAITPICAVCVLGPAAVGAMFAGAFGWIGEIGPLGIGLAMAIAAGTIHTIYLRRLKRRQTVCGCEDAPIESPSKEAARRLSQDSVVPLSVGNWSFDESMVSKE